MSKGYCDVCKSVREGVVPLDYVWTCEDCCKKPPRCGEPFRFVMGDGWVVRCERDAGHNGGHRGAVVRLSDPFPPPDLIFWEQ